MIKYADRVKETSTTTGTGAYTLAGAEVGFRAFGVLGDGAQCHYCATDGTDWETVTGAYTLVGTTLSRDTILASSNAGAAIDWAAGTREVFLIVPADYFGGMPLNPMIDLDPQSASGTTIPDNAGLYDGTITRGTLVTDATEGQVIEFAGDGVVDVPTDERVRFVGDMAFIGRFWFSALHDVRFVKCGELGETYATNTLYDLRMLSTGAWNQQHEYGSGATNYDEEVAGIFTAGSWITVGFIRSQHTYDLYLDGVYTASLGFLNNPEKAESSNIQDLTFGAGNDGGLGLVGRMGRVLLYGRSLHPHEMLRIHQILTGA